MTPFARCYSMRNVARTDSKQTSQGVCSSVVARLARCVATDRVQLAPEQAHLAASRAASFPNRDEPH